MDFLADTSLQIIADKDKEKKKRALIKRMKHDE